MGQGGHISRLVRLVGARHRPPSKMRSWWSERWTNKALPAPTHELAACVVAAPQLVCVAIGVATTDLVADCARRARLQWRAFSWCRPHLHWAGSAAWLLEVRVIEGEHGLRVVEYLGLPRENKTSEEPTFCSRRRLKCDRLKGLLTGRIFENEMLRYADHTRLSFRLTN